jgi:preprotein translocase subunit SecG
MIQTIQTVVLVVHVLIAVAMVGLVLLQRSEGGGLGMGRADSFMSTRGQANLLTRSTAICAGLFFATSIGLALMAGTHNKPRSILDGAGTPASPSAPATPGLGGAPAVPPPPSAPTR